ncbi:hypothetical protein C0L85_06945, partial [Clostridium perfringens]
YCLKTIFHWTLIYPYLVIILEKNVFNVFSADISQINEISQRIFKNGLENRNYEAVSYAIYFAIKYKFELSDICAYDAIKSDHCIYKLLTYIYFAKNNDNKSKELLEDHAKNLKSNDEDFNRNWLFVYEVLPVDCFEDEWKAIKRNNVSFINI